MPRIRTIKPEFWDDLKLAKMSRDARLLYIGMWNFADDLGVIIGDPIWIKSRIFPFDQIQVQQFAGWLTDLVKHGFISLFSYNQEEFYYLPNLTRHQVINRPNTKNANVPYNELIEIFPSLIHHGTISDESCSGKEGKGKEWRGKEGSSPPSTSDSVSLETIDECTAKLKACGEPFFFLVRNALAGRANVQSVSELGVLIDVFSAELKARGDALKNPKDFQSHFMNWLKKPGNATSNQGNHASVIYTD